MTLLGTTDAPAFSAIIVSHLLLWVPRSKQVISIGVRNVRFNS